MAQVAKESLIEKIIISTAVEKSFKSDFNS